MILLMTGFADASILDDINSWISSVFDGGNPLVGRAIAPAGVADCPNYNNSMTCNNDPACIWNATSCIIQESPTTTTSSTTTTTTSSTTVTTLIQNTCFDSDGGSNIYTKGNVSGMSNGNPYTNFDMCSTPDTIYEYICINSTYSNMQTLSCGSGYTCTDGACIFQSNATTTTTVPVNGTTTTTTIPTNQTTYSVNFSRSFVQNIQDSVSWWVVVGGVTYTSTNSSITVSGLSGTVSYYYATILTVSSDARYSCSTGCSGSVSSSTTVTPSYTTQYLLTLLSNPSNGGTISPPFDAPYWYSIGGSASLTAFPNQGYVFSSWNGSGNGSYSGITNPITVFINSPITEIANFVTSTNQTTTTTLPPFNGTTTTMPYYNGTTTTTMPPYNGTTTTLPYYNYTTTTMPYGNYTTTTMPYYNWTTSTTLPYYNYTTTTYPPYGNWTTTTMPSGGYCGDKICSDYEKNSNSCPVDCQYTKTCTSDTECSNYEKCSNNTCQYLECWKEKPVDSTACRRETQNHQCVDMYCGANEQCITETHTDGTTSSWCKVVTSCSTDNDCQSYDYCDTSSKTCKSLFCNVPTDPNACYSMTENHKCTNYYCPSGQECAKDTTSYTTGSGYCRPVGGGGEYGKCSDKIDNDNDRMIDCIDPDCGTDTSCMKYCGNMKCEFGEDPMNCPADCGSGTKLCSTNSDCTNLICPTVVGGDAPKCSPKGQCYCGGVCGDQYCDYYEQNSGACSTDCYKGGEYGMCSDGIDNENDGMADCKDPDCGTDPTCVREFCGNGYCGFGEDAMTCPTDCGGSACGCDTGSGCQAGCPCDPGCFEGNISLSPCGDNICQPWEDANNCQKDCSLTDCSSIPVIDNNILTNYKNTGKCFDFSQGMETTSNTDCDLKFTGSGYKGDIGIADNFYTLTAGSGKIMGIGPYVNLNNIWQISPKDSQSYMQSFPLYQVEDGLALITTEGNYAALVAKAASSDSITFSYKYSASNILGCPTSTGCFQYSDENSCRNAMMTGMNCYWDFTMRSCNEQNIGIMPTTPIFKNPDCGIFTGGLGAEGCNKVDGCYWDANVGGLGYGECVGTIPEVKCENIKDEGMCNKIPLLSTCCSWSSETGACQSTTDITCREKQMEPPEGAKFCEDYNALKSETLCKQIAGDPWYMPCAWNTEEQRCGFNQQGMFTSGTGTFGDINSKSNCEAAGGIWKSSVYTYTDQYETTKTGTDEWCEMNFGYNAGTCDTSCWACEKKSDGSEWTDEEEARLACQNSKLGICEFHPDSLAMNGIGFCDVKKDFIGGSTCDFNCYDCTKMQNKQEACDNSNADCKWIADSTADLGGYCQPINERSCDNDCFQCDNSESCSQNGPDCTWTDNNICTPKGFTGEICFDGIDNNNNGEIDCKDPKCAFDTFCGGGMISDCPKYGDQQNCESNECIWMNEGSKGWCADPGEKCVQFDGDETGCTSQTDCQWSAGSECDPKNIMKGCPDYTKEECLSKKECSWDYKSLKCQDVLSFNTLKAIESPPVILGNDPCGGNSPDRNISPEYDICTFGLKEEPDSYALGTGVGRIVDSVACRGVPVKSDRDTLVVGTGIKPSKFYWYIDTDGNSANSCKSGDDKQNGFEFFLKYETQWVTNATESFTEGNWNLNGVTVNTGDVTISGRGWLEARGNGSIPFRGNARIELNNLGSGGTATLTITDYSGSKDTDIWTSDGFSSKISGGVVTYTGKGSAVIKGSDIGISLEGNGIYFYGEGVGQVTMKGTGAYKKGRYSGNVDTTMVAYRCIDGNWSPIGVKLTSMRDKMCSMLKGGVIVVNKDDIKKLGVFNSTANMRIYAATATESNNELNPADTIGPAYYTPGTIDFKFTDCFAPGNNDPNCQKFKKFGFVQMENCINGVDDDSDGSADCADQKCKFSPDCNKDFTKIQKDANDKTAPKITFHKVDAFPDGAFVIFHTDEPSNGTIDFYSTDSVCNSLNATIVELGDPNLKFDDYKPFHGAHIDNFKGNPYKLGYDLAENMTYYYKTTNCDPSGNCAYSACSNFTTKTKSGMKEFVIKFNLPPMMKVDMDFGGKGTYDITDDAMNYGKKVNYSEGKMTNVKFKDINLSSAIELTGMSFTSSKDLNLTDAFVIKEQGNKTLVGIDTDKWQEIKDLIPESIKITIPDSGDALYKCKENGENCTEVTAGVDKIENESNETQSTWTVPVSIGFSVYKVGEVTICPVKGDTATCDGKVSDFELLDYISEWAKGNVDDFDLLSAIDKWAKG